MLRKIFAFNLALVALSLAMCMTAGAASNYPSYVVSDDAEMMQVPEPYDPTSVVFLKALTEDGAAKPTDIYIDGDDQVYIAEEGNNRVVKMDKSGKILLSVGEGQLNAPKGVFADSDKIYVADSGNNRIAIFDQNGVYQNEIIKPQSELLEDDFDFTPEKLIVDDRGYFYIVCKGNENGLFMIDGKNEFRGFFGANITQVSMVDILVRTFYSKESRAGKLVTLPFSYTNVGINDGYIYTATTGATQDQIRRLGPTGSDSLFDGEHKNFEDSILSKTGKEQNFIDFAVDYNKNLLVLDETYGRIYQYDQNGEMMFAFGDIGFRKGNFVKPSSIAIDGESNLYVTDSERNCVTIFTPNPFAKSVNVANQYYNEGKYNEAYACWEEVLACNNHYEIAQQAMGYILLRKEDYQGAMSRFLQADDKEGYSEAFEEQRAVYVNSHFPMIVVVVVILVLALSAFSIIMKRKRKAKVNKSVWESKNTFQIAWKIVWHQFETLGEMKYQKTASYRDAVVMVGSYAVIRIISVVVSSFLYRSTSLAMTDWVYEIGLAVAPWFLLSVSNYGICTLGDGEGKFKEIMVSGAFTLAPFLFFSLPLALLTKWLSLSESGFLQLFQIFLFLLCGFIVFAIHQEIHNLSISKTIFIFVLTIVGALMMGYLMVLFYGLLMQLLDFISQIMREVTLLAF